jgi:tripartite-type tricarboxylate transporter receptor subunit TctC
MKHWVHGMLSVVPCLAVIGDGVAHAQADAYPSRPIRMIVPFVPGGSTDIIARLVARKMTDGMGQQVVVDNRSGGGGTMGAETTVRANPDGYTLILVSGSYTVNPALHKLPYDPVRDVTPISMVGAGPFVVASHPSLAAKTVRELIDYAKANPGKINYGSGGTGSLTHLVIELFKLMAGIDMTHVPYKGSGQVITDLIGGQVHLTFGATLSMLPHVTSGKLRGIAVTGKSRSPVIPDLPTVAESGLPGYEAISWYGMLAPPRLPTRIVLALNNEMKRIVSLPDIRERLGREGFEAMHTTPEAFAQTMAEDVAKWPKVVKAANIRAE